MPTDDALTLRRTLTVKWEQGLHLRPAQQIAAVARRHVSSVKLTRENRTADARNILDILGLAAEPGAVLELEVQGSDAAAVIEEIVALFYQAELVGG